jgi:hypothetical protein
MSNGDIGRLDCQNNSSREACTVFEATLFIDQILCSAELKNGVNNDNSLGTGRFCRTSPLNAAQKPQASAH